MDTNSVTASEVRALWTSLSSTREELTRAEEKMRALDARVKMEEVMERACASLREEKAVLQSRLEEAIDVGVSRLADLEYARREASLLRVQNESLSRRVAELVKDERRRRDAALNARAAVETAEAARSAPTKRRRAVGDSVQSTAMKNRKKMIPEADEGIAVRRSSQDELVQGEQRASQLVTGTTRAGVVERHGEASDAAKGDVALVLRDHNSDRVERRRNDNDEDNDEEDFVDAKTSPTSRGGRGGGCDGAPGNLVRRAASGKQNTHPRWRKYPKRERECHNIPDFDFHVRSNSNVVTNRPIEDQRKRDTPPERWRLSQSTLDSL